MIYENYVLHLKGTIDTYSTKIKNHLLKLFEEKGIIQTENQKSLFERPDAVTVVDLELQEKLKETLNITREAVKIFEEWEFIRDYKYSTLFLPSDFEKFIDSCSKFTALENCECENDYLSDGFSDPTKYETDELLLLKFSLKYAAINNISGSELLLKYPVIIVCHKSLSIVEIRFDTLKRDFLTERKAQTIYGDVIRTAQDWCVNSLENSLGPLNLDFLIRDVVDSKGDSNVKLMAQYVKLPSGGNAQLDVGKNEDYILPIIGELKELLQNPSHLVELEKCPQLKTSLDQFMLDNEQLSYYSWIEILWENEVKTRSVRVKFIFDYKNNGYCLMQHYYNQVLIGMERMNYVANHINKRRIDETTQSNLTKQWAAAIIP
ncbi:MAG: hypothetical protein R3Y07_09680 [Eubacteriales bacterium]